jgi:hypothetical protein
MKDRHRLRPTCLASTEGDELHERDQRQDARHPGEREVAVSIVTARSTRLS